jgi:MFS family permease
MSPRAGRRLFTLSVYLFWLAHYLYMPTLPVYLRSKTGNLGQVGTVLAMFGLWQVVVRFPLGRLVDRVGRRKLFIIAGAALAGLGALVLCRAGGFWGLMAGRSLTGISMATWVLQVVVFSAFFEPREALRAGAVLTLVSSLAKLTATSLTGMLNTIGGYSLPFFLSATAVVAAMLLLIPVSDPTRRISASPPQAGYVRELLKKPSVVYPTLLAIICQFINFSVTFGFLPLLAGQLGADDVLKSLLLSTNILALILGNLLVTGLAGRINAVVMMTVSFSLFTISVAGTALTGQLGWLFVLQALLGLAHGIGYPTLIGTTLSEVPPNQRSTAMGLHQTVYALGMFAGPWLSGHLADLIGVRGTFGIIAGGCAVFSTLLIRGLRRRR